MERPAAEGAGELVGVGRGRRRGHDLRPRAQVAADPQQPRQHVVEVAAEDAAVGVQLVEDDPAEIAQQALPALPVAEHPEVQHVRVADQHPRRVVPDPLALAARAVAVVDRGEAVAETGATGKRLQLGPLVLTQGLQRIEEQGAPTAAGQCLFQHRQLEDERFSRRRRGGDQEVLALPHRGQTLGLVTPEAADADPL